MCDRSWHWHADYSSGRFQICCKRVAFLALLWVGRTADQLRECSRHSGLLLVWLLQLTAHCIAVARRCCNQVLAAAQFLALVFDPAPQLLDIRVHTKEFVACACLCMVHLRTRTMDSGTRQCRKC